MTIPLSGFCDAVDDLVTQHMSRKQIPGAAIAVIKDGRSIGERYYGTANLESGTMVDKHSVFEIASLTKPITATAVVRASESGLLQLTDPITKYLVDAPVDWQTITIANLLNHTGGFAEQLIVSCDGVPVLDVSTAAQYELIKATPVTFPPGEAAGYSDPGYFLLGMILESATALPYRDVIEKYIYGPCNMDNAGLLDQFHITPGRVAGYSVMEGKLVNGRRVWQHELPSFFGVTSTLEDLVKFAIAYDNENLITPANRELMQNPGRDNNGVITTVWGRPYGFGWMVDDYRGFRVYEHGGFSGTHLLRVPAAGLTVIVLTNLDVRSGSKPDQLARAVAGAYDDRFIPPHFMGHPNDQNPIHSDSLLAALQSVSNDVSPQLTTSYVNQINSLPPPVKERVVGLNNRLKNLDFVALDRPAEDGLQRLDLTVAKIEYYRTSIDGRDLLWTIWLDDGGKIIDAQPYFP